MVGIEFGWQPATSGFFVETSPAICLFFGAESLTWKWAPKNLLIEMASSTQAIPTGSHTESTTRDSRHGSLQQR